MHRTSDGIEITDGLLVWNYDLERSRVKIAGTWADPKSKFHEYWDGWFKMCAPDDASIKMPIMNGPRMCVTHPYTGIEA